MLKEIDVREISKLGTIKFFFNDFDRGTQNKETVKCEYYMCSEGSVQ